MSDDDEIPFDKPVPLVDRDRLENLFANEAELHRFLKYRDSLDEHGRSVMDAVKDEYGKLKSRRLARELDRNESAGPPSWARVDPAEALEAAEHPIMPTVGRFAGQDSFGVFYAGCINSVVGPSEMGKSWFAQFVAHQEMKAGHNVVYVDYEDNARSVYRRLKQMSMTDEELSGPLFKYHNPNGPLTDLERKELENSLADGGTMLICDGVTEGMGLEGLDTYKGEDVATWHARVTRNAANDGWSVVIIDHTPHSADRAIGSQHKKASITGVSYIVTAPDDGHIDQGVRGVLHLAVEKDRHGSVRAEAARGKSPRRRGDLVVDGTQTPMTFHLYNANKTRVSDDDKGYEATPPRPQLEAVMGFVRENPKCSQNEVVLGVKGKATQKIAVLSYLVRNEHIVITHGSRNKQEHTVITELPSPPGEFE